MNKNAAELKRAALLHDIGKIGIPDRILNKPERLTDEEYKEMKSHVVRGGEIFKEFYADRQYRRGSVVPS